MEYIYKQSLKGKIALCIVIAVLLIAIIGSVFVVLSKKDNNATGSTYQEGMVMTATPSIRYGSINNGLRFTAEISPETYEEVMSDPNKSFGLVIAAFQSYLEADTEEGTGNVDWINAFKNSSLAMINMEEIIPAANTMADGTLIDYKLSGVLLNIKYENTNKQFLGVAYVKTVDGDNVSYKYASFPDGLSYKECAYSYAYIAAERLNSSAVSSEHLAQEDIDLLKGVIDKSVDLANGLATPMLDGSTYTVTLSDKEKNLAVGEELNIEVDVAEGIKTPVWWQSSDATIATVKNGVVMAHKEGTTTIYAIVAGEAYTCVITVGEVQANTEAVTE